MSHPNRDLIQRAYDAFGRGDIPTVLGIVDKEIRWHVPGQSPLSGEYIGHEQVLGFFQKSMELSGRTFQPATWPFALAKYLRRRAIPAWQCIL